MNLKIYILDNSTKEELKKTDVDKEKQQIEEKSEAKTVMFDLQSDRRLHQFLDFKLFIRLLIIELRILLLSTIEVTL